MVASVTNADLPAFIRLGDDGRIASAWSLSRPDHGHFPETGLQHVAALVRFFRATPDATGTALLARILTAPEFLSAESCGAREGFLAGIVANLVRDATPLPAPPTRRLAFAVFGDHGQIERAWDPDFGILEADGGFTFTDGTRLGGIWARRYVARLQHDPIALSDRLLHRIVAEPEFRSERSRGLRIGFTCELARRMARVRLVDERIATDRNTAAAS